MKAKLITAAALTLAGCGLLASRNPTAERRSPAGPEPPAAVNRIVPASAPVETPLVAKLIPGGGESESPSKAAPPALRDGQLSPGGQWRWSESQWAWIPVKSAGPAWVQDGHSATIHHLATVHGYSPSYLSKLTQSQLDVLHSNAHNAARAAAPVRSSGCPGGVCPSPSRGGLFRRR